MKYPWLLLCLYWLGSAILCVVEYFVSGVDSATQMNLRFGIALACFGMFSVSRLQERLKKLDGLDF